MFLALLGGAAVGVAAMRLPLAAAHAAALAAKLTREKISVEQAVRIEQPGAAGMLFTPVEFVQLLLVQGRLPDGVAAMVKARWGEPDESLVARAAERYAQHCG